MGTVEGVGDGEILIGFENGRIGGAQLVLGVVEEFVASEIPAPGLVVGSHQTLVADGMEGRLLGGHAHDGVRSALPRRPVQLPDVESARETHPTADAVGALSHRVPVERQRVVLLHEDVQRPVLSVPRVFQLHLSARSPQISSHEHQQSASSRLDSYNPLPLISHLAPSQSQSSLNPVSIPPVKWAIGTATVRQDRKKEEEEEEVYLDVGGISRRASRREGLVKSCGISWRELQDLAPPNDE